MLLLQLETTNPPLDSIVVVIIQCASGRYSVMSTSSKMATCVAAPRHPSFWDVKILISWPLNTTVIKECHLVRSQHFIISPCPITSLLHMLWLLRGRQNAIIYSTSECHNGHEKIFAKSQRFTEYQMCIFTRPCKYVYVLEV